MSQSTGFDQLLETIRGYRFRFRDEQELQEGLWLALTQNGYAPDREVVLGSDSRIDFMVGTIGIEVKIDGSETALIRQVHRYMYFAEIQGLVVVTSLLRLTGLPETINDKPLHAVYVGNAF